MCNADVDIKCVTAECLSNESLGARYALIHQHQAILQLETVHSASNSSNLIALDKAFCVRRWFILTQDSNCTT